MFPGRVATQFTRISAGLLLLAAACTPNASDSLDTASSGTAGTTNPGEGGAGSPGAPGSTPGPGSGGSSAGAGAQAAGSVAANSGNSSTRQAGRAGSSPASANGESGSGGAAGASGEAAGAGSSAGAGGEAEPDAGAASPALEHFSFFATSLAGLRRLAQNDKGFGGDLRYGEQDGLSGADKICSELAEASMPGAATKGWRAFLSVAEGPEGGPVHAIDRVGDGPWYDRLGRVVALDKDALLNTRPMGADPAIVNDLPNEDGVPNHQPDPSEQPVNNHHFLTGSDTAGKLYMNRVTSTCDNWTSTAQSAGRPRIGFSYPAGNRQHWISGQDEGGCGAGYVLEDRGGSDPSNPIVGSGGGYGGFYCFALAP